MCVYTIDHRIMIAWHERSEAPPCPFRFINTTVSMNQRNILSAGPQETAVLQVASTCSKSHRLAPRNDHPTAQHVASFEHHPDHYRLCRERHRMSSQLAPSLIELRRPKVNVNNGYQRDEVDTGLIKKCAQSFTATV